MLAPFTLALAIATAVADDVSLACAVMAAPIPKSVRAAVEYAGLYVPFCCPGCERSFAQEPERYLKAARKGTAPVAVALFDPVARIRVNETDGRARRVFQGVRYVFLDERNARAFAQNPTRYATRPEKESLTCPVEGETLAAYSRAKGYFDYEGVRYYVCRAECLPRLQADPSGTFKDGRAKPATPRSVKPPRA